MMMALTDQDSAELEKLRRELARLEERAARIQGTNLTLETWTQELEQGTAMIRVSPALAEGETAEEAATHEVVLRPPSYFIGRKIVSATELDDVVKGYYRWAEASLNLIIPFLALGVAIYQRWPPWGIWSLFLATLLTWVLLRSARRRHQEYKHRVRDFIEGRLRSYEEEKKQKANAKTMDEVVQSAKKLLAQMKKATE
jgi:hypothetical protein